ncbi:MAG TPA: carboxylating nicotinate-nucleotide diphosphorylase [Ignavibacteria bacterium]
MYEEMTLKEFYKHYDAQINKAIDSALNEDKIFQDITTKKLLAGDSGSKMLTAKLLCKEDCIAAGLNVFKKIYLRIDPGAKFNFFYKDSDFVRNKAILLEVKSTLKNLLIGERTALNFLQRMSGIATLTNYFVKKLKFKGAKILHTRKTTPNFRVFELAAVKIGGGDFHRFDLSSAVLVKDNHIRSAGSLEKAINILKRKNITGERLEIEAKTEDEIETIIRYGKGIIKIVMLDNFSESKLESAIKKLKQHGYKIELSGGINQQNFEHKQREGIDYYSIGMLTHSYKSIDSSLEF